MNISHLWSSELDMSIFSERLKLLRSARNITQAGWRAINGRCTGL